MQRIGRRLVPANCQPSASCSEADETDPLGESAARGLELGGDTAVGRSSRAEASRATGPLSPAETGRAAGLLLLVLMPSPVPAGPLEGGLDLGMRSSQGLPSG